ncbi:hypothetical protein CTEN210_02367 [Chaetoceros tenuissimus]|uniref:Thioredoxin domain-containing protein n=1 Tax=Chaetoceros tenuissimus TaxID=426638 RepID=A0AAD3CHF1_9STRA|nr:hypothetical protein CTEN210_02367 [Chaetoceros tenuissimus]
MQLSIIFWPYVQVLFLFSLGTHVSCSESSISTRKTHIVELTDENFEHLTQASSGQTTGKWVVNFSSPTCPHCVSLYPTYKQLSETLMTTEEHKQSGVIVALVDSSKNPKLLQRFSVNSFPTLLYFADQSMFQFPPKSPRTQESLLQFVLGGYQENEKMSVPGNNIVLQAIEDLRRKVHNVKVFNDFLNDVEHIVMYRKNAAAMLIGFGALLGVLMSSLFRLLTSSTKKQKKD